jgi:hypothetical protein
MEEDKHEDKRANEGGFNPRLPERAKTETVGPMPTDDPKGVASPSVKEKIKKAAS